MLRPQSWRRLSIAGVPGAVIDECENVIENCEVCRTWERPRSKPLVRTGLFLVINKRVCEDVLHYIHQNAEGILVLHLMGNDSRWK